MILPLKLRGVLTYYIPESLVNKVEVGCWVVVSLRGRKYYGVVNRIGELLQAIEPSNVLPIESVVENLPLVTNGEYDFYNKLAEYYLCSIGEVLKAAYPTYYFQQAQKKRGARRKVKSYKLQSTPVKLNPLQQSALSEIKESFAKKKNVLLKGVTGSGKTELYIKLALEALEAGKNVLYLVPEIALSHQLEERLGAVFGAKLLVWHSRRTSAAKKDIFEKIQEGNEPYILLGTRSSVLLPLSGISLIIVDEEHDVSYKQEDPAPRYNGRDVALMIAAVNGANVVLGSATPSLESLFNAQSGKLTIVELATKYYNAPDAEVSVIDMRQVSRLRNTKGSFSMKLINEIASTLAAGRQVLIFRSRRSYASFVQCNACGDVPKCPHCNIPLSYHKFSNTLNCHYCGYKRKYYATCKNCQSNELCLLGAGTERLEEELKEYFPQAKIARLDADISSSKVAEDEILNDFSSGKIDILVGTQMISKGFDFPNLALVAVISADSMLAVDDFRADERTLQLLHQLSGRSGRRGDAGKVFIQTFQPEHKVFSLLREGFDSSSVEDALVERKQFGFPPFVRLVAIYVRDYDFTRLREICDKVAEVLNKLSIKDYFGPIVPQVDRVKGKHVMLFWVKLPRTAKAQQLKQSLATEIDLLRGSYRSSSEIVLDVDPK